MNRALIGLIVLGAIYSYPALAQTDSKAAGHWQGKIQLPDREIPVAVDLTKNPKGEWIGSISVPGTPLNDVPLVNVAIAGTAVKFAADLGERAQFNGDVSADGASISGKASNSNGEAPFQMQRSGEANVKVPSASSALPKEFEGSWEGTINAGGQTLRVRLKLAPGADGSAAGTLTSLDQGNAEFPVTTVTIQGKQLKLDVRNVGGSYDGTLGANGEIAGNWSQGGGTIPLAFKRPAAGK